jgi:hypothetical protein
MGLACRYMLTQFSLLPLTRSMPDAYYRAWCGCGGKRAHASSIPNTIVNLLRPKRPGWTPPRPSPMPIALAHSLSALFFKTCIPGVFTPLFSKCITRANGVNFYAASIYIPATIYRAVNMVPTPPKVSDNFARSRIKTFVFRRTTMHVPCWWFYYARFSWPEQMPSLRHSY